MDLIPHPPSLACRPYARTADTRPWTATSYDPWRELRSSRFEGRGAGEQEKRHSGYAYFKVPPVIGYVGKQLETDGCIIL